MFIRHSAYILIRIYSPQRLLSVKPGFHMSGTCCFPTVPDVTDMSRKPRILDDTIFVVTGETGSNQSPNERRLSSAEHFGRLGMTKDFVLLLGGKIWEVVKALIGCILSRHMQNRFKRIKKKSIKSQN